MKKFLVYVILLLSIFNLVTTFTNASGRGNDFKYKTVQVYSGDTIWSIAKENNHKNKDIRQYIYEIRKINNLNSINIKPGDTIKIPIEKND